MDGLHLVRDQLFDSNSVSSYRSSWPFFDFPSPPSPLKMNVIGDGEVTVALGMDFIPKKVYTEPIYRGIFVEKTIREVDPFSGEMLGENLLFNNKKVISGTTVRVTIQVSLFPIHISTLPIQQSPSCTYDDYILSLIVI